VLEDTWIKLFAGVEPSLSRICIVSGYRASKEPTSHKSKHLVGSAMPE